MEGSMNGADVSRNADRAIAGEVVVDAPVSEVWAACTTEEGVRSFFAPDCSIDLRIDGRYEMYFLSDGEPGKRGGEGVRFLAIQPQKMLSFTWNAPPHLSETRAQWTHVVVRFFEAGAGRTRVTLRHDGWGEGGQWDETFAYFEHAWLEAVLPSLVRRFKGAED
jgi:uncharacterized protein YndB with AHSA1/START domain